MKTPGPSPRIEPLEPRIAPSTLLGLDNANQLLRFNSASPGTLAANTAVTGLGAGETLVGIDFRPATGQLYVGIKKLGFIFIFHKSVKTVEILDLGSAMCILPDSSNAFLILP